VRIVLFLSLFLVSIALGVPVLLLESKAVDEQVPLTYPKNYFRSPLTIPLTLAGNFGEIRNNHFHSGLDFKTENREGLPIVAPADGYVSRIKVQAAGYGNALYITHPNGYVTVYGHLSAYNEAITAYLRKQQYQLESFEVDVKLDPKLLPIKQGDIVALSGNTGGSRGPHLHFEVRDEKTEFAINPLLFGFDVKDSVKPVISKVALYPMNELSFIDGKCSSTFYSLIPRKGMDAGLAYAAGDTIKVHGFIGFGLTTFDTEDARTNVNGTYSVEVNVDNEQIYLHKINSFSFDQWRYVNAHIDYPSKKNKGLIIQRCYLLPNNKLPIYEVHKNRGYFLFTDSKAHLIKLTAKDIFGNSKSVSFYVKSAALAPYIPPIMRPKNMVEKFLYNKPNSFATNDFKISLPKDVIYNDINFEFYVSDSTKGIAPIYHVHRDDEPVQALYEIAIKPRKLVSRLQNKTVIVSLNGGARVSEGGEWDPSFGGIKTQTKTFGNFSLAIDTIPPVLAPINAFANKKITAIKWLRFRMYDSLSGIKSYRGTIDGKWILMQCDAKSNLLYYIFDSNIGPGKHELKVLVEDKKGNSKVYAYNFSR
jgi:hypothetical protein